MTQFAEDVANVFGQRNVFSNIFATAEDIRMVATNGWVAILNHWTIQHILIYQLNCKGYIASRNAVLRDRCLFHRNLFGNSGSKSDLKSFVHMERNKDMMLRLMSPYSITSTLSWRLPLLSGVIPLTILTSTPHLKNPLVSLPRCGGSAYHGRRFLRKKLASRPCWCGVRVPCMISWVTSWVTTQNRSAWLSRPSFSWPKKFHSGDGWVNCRRLAIGENLWLKLRASLPRYRQHHGETWKSTSTCYSASARFLLPSPNVYSHCHLHGCYRSTVTTRTTSSYWSCTSLTLQTCSLDIVSVNGGSIVSFVENLSFVSEQHVWHMKHGFACMGAQQNNHLQQASYLLEPLLQRQWLAMWVHVDNLGHGV